MPIRLLVVLFLPLLLALPAHARGGQYRGPGGRVPPSLREPSDPTPPPPPPPVGAPAGRMPTVPTVRTPSTPPPPSTPRAPIAVRVPAPSRSARIRPLSFEDWTFWHHHRGGILEWPLGRVPRIRPDPLDETADLHADALAAIVAAARGGPDIHTATGAAGLVALGRVSTAPEHVDLLLGALAAAGGRSVYERESAAIGLGLLRRWRWSLEEEVLGRVRDALFQVLASDREPGRLRGFCGAALGLLGDQADADRLATTARLFEVFPTHPPHPDVLVGTLLGLSRQHPESFTADQRRFIRTLAYDGHLGDRQAFQLLRCHALTVLGTIGAAEDLARMSALLHAERGVDANTKRSAVLALGALGRRFAVEQKIQVVETLLALVTSNEPRSDLTARLYAIAVLPDLLEPLAGEGSREAIGRTLVGEVLLTKAAYGTFLERPWAALAIAAMLREGPHTRPAGLGGLEDKARRVLRAGLDREGRERAAFALALGIAVDRESEPTLRDLARDRTQLPEVRGYALLGLALGVSVETPTRLVMRDSVHDRVSEQLRMLATTSLGLMDEASIPAVADVLRQGRSSQLKGAAAKALATIGTPDAARALLELAESDEPHTRSKAIAGLGRLLDPGIAPSLVLLTWRLNYRASTDLVNELLSIL